MDLHGRLKEIRESLNKSQSDFAEYLGVSRQNLSRYESGQYNVPDEVKMTLFQKAGVDPNWYFTGQGEMFTGSGQLTVRVPILDVKASAGYGYLNLDNPAILGYFDLEKNLIAPYPPDKVVFLQVRGDSMEPTYRDGDWVAVAVGVIESNDIYAININGRALIKRLQFIRREKVIVMSENKAYRDEEIGPEFSEHFSIIGKVYRHIRKV